MLRFLPASTCPDCANFDAMSYFVQNFVCTGHMDSARFFSLRKAFTSLLLAGFLLPGKAFGWGKTGHAVVADIAQTHLTPTALAEVQRLLAVEGDHNLSDISSWADKAKREGLAGSPSHTIRLPLDNSPAGEHPCPGHFCADDAITLYSAVLADPKHSDADREIALKYIVHLVGDLHQPLHDTDATGSGIQVIFDGKPSELHAVWDDGIIDEHGGSAREIALELMQSEKGVPDDGGPMQWAEEGRIIAQKQIYNTIPVHPTSVVVLPSSYGRDEWPIVKLRLTEGGLRLAILLNSLLK
jgi:hypothetical protein